MKKKKYTIAVLPGDGIGPEVVAVGVSVLKAIESISNISFEFKEALIGGAAYDATGQALPPPTLFLCQKSDAVLMGPVGGPKWDYLEFSKKPEKALLDLRKKLECYVNLRPVNLFNWNHKSSPLNYQLLSQGFNLTIIRDISSGMYMGDRGRSGVVGTIYESAYDVEAYEAKAVHRIADFAFNLARQRKLKITNIDKSNLLESSRLWREVIQRIAVDFPDVVLENLYVDHAFTRLLRNPKSFDIILCNNVYGDIASDISAALVGSYAALPSASLTLQNGPSLFEAVHGTAPDLMFKNMANPLGIVLSVVLLLEYGLHEKDAANFLKKAVHQTLDEGYRTFDFLTEEQLEIWYKADLQEQKNLPFKLLGTKEMDEALVATIEKMKPLK